MSDATHSSLEYWLRVCQAGFLAWPQEEDDEDDEEGVGDGNLNLSSGVEGELSGMLYLVRDFSWEWGIRFCLCHTDLSLSDLSMAAQKRIEQVSGQGIYLAATKQELVR